MNSSRTRTNMADSESRVEKWPIHPLSSLVEKIFVGVPTSRYSACPDDVSVSVPVLNVAHIGDEEIVHLDDIPRVDLRSADFERFRLRADDIVVSCRGTLLKAARVRPEMDRVLASANIITIRPNQARFLPQLILVLLRSPMWQESLKSRGQSSTGLMQITVKDLENMSVPVPSLDVQSSLAVLFDAEAIARRAALEAADLRGALVESLIIQALTGRDYRVVQ